MWMYHLNVKTCILPSAWKVEKRSQSKQPLWRLLYWISREEGSTRWNWAAPAELSIEAWAILPQPSGSTHRDVGHIEQRTSFWIRFHIGNDRTYNRGVWKPRRTISDHWRWENGDGSLPEMVTNIRSRAKRPMKRRWPPASRFDLNHHTQSMRAHIAQIKSESQNDSLLWNGGGAEEPQVRIGRLMEWASTASHTWLMIFTKSARINHNIIKHRRNA